MGRFVFVSISWTSTSGLSLGHLLIGRRDTSFQLSLIFIFFVGSGHFALESNPAIGHTLFVPTSMIEAMNAHHLVGPMSVNLMTKLTRCVQRIYPLFEFRLYILSARVLSGGLTTMHCFAVSPLEGCVSRLREPENGEYSPFKMLSNKPFSALVMIGVCPC